ncbi:MAG: glycosyltransferase family 9 protein [Bacteroidetes bacterium]|nr:glycosyltransferase family 9 protein [Bacteroidota bacterium]
MNKRSITGRITSSFAWYLGLLKKRDRGSGRKGVLIIRTDLIGDFILFSPALKYLRKKYDGMNISLVVQNVAGGIAEENTYIDDIIILNKKKYRLNMIYRILFLWKIRKRRFRIAINAVYSRDIISDEIALWTNAEEKIGWDTNIPNMFSDEKARGDRIYTQLYASKYEAPDTHELLRNRELLEFLGENVHDFLPEIIVAEKKRIKARQIIGDNDLSKKILIGLVTDTGDKYRNWTLDKYTKLVNMISQEYPNIAIILLGKKYSGSLKTENECRLFDLRGKTDISELPAIIERCVLIIGGETGPIHIANALGIPAICILGGGHYKRFIPYPEYCGSKNVITPVFHKMDCFTCGWNCIHNDNNEMPYPCINNITVDGVFNVVKNKISKLNIIKE